MTGDPKASVGSLRRGARVAAVQALYQMELNGGAPDTVIAEFESFRLRRNVADVPVEVPSDIDETMFADLVQGVTAGMAAVDALIEGALDKNRSVARLEVIMRAILRAGAYELSRRDDIDAALTISEYVAVADTFFNDREPALANAVLDRIARHVAQGDGAAEAVHDATPDG